MTRLLGLFVLAVALWVFLEVAWSRVRRALAPPAPSIPPKMPPPAPPERLVRCSECNSHVPAARALAGADERVLCDRCRP